MKLENEKTLLLGKTALIVGREGKLREAVIKKFKLEGAIVYLLESGAELPADFPITVDVVVNLFGTAVEAEYLLVRSQKIINDKGSFVNVVIDPEEIKKYQTEDAHKVTMESAGIIALGKLFTRELGVKGIRINSLCMGPADIEEFIKLLPDGVTLGQILQQRSLPQLPTVNDFPKAIAFFSSDESSYVTGQAIPIRDDPR